MTTRAILVAGGQGERLGLEVMKALAVVGGVTLLARAVAVLERVSDEIVIAAPADVEPELPRTTVPLRRVDDRAPGGCPLAGAVAGWEGGCDRAIVLGVDFPLMRPEALAALARRMDAMPNAVAVVPAPGGRLQPLAAVYAASACASMTAAFEAGERSIVWAVKRLGPEVVGDDELQKLPGGRENFFNLNTPEDRAFAERRVSAGTAPA